MKTESRADSASSNLDGNKRVGSVSSGSALSWKVRVVVCGTHAGDYEHPTYEAARADADERKKKYGVLGCHYRVIAPAGNLWCAMCGQWTDHQSGTCPELLPQNVPDEPQARSKLSTQILPYA